MPSRDDELETVHEGTMNRLWDVKLLKAWAIAVGLFAFGPLGITAGPLTANTFWSMEVWPRLSPILMAALIAAAALVTARVARPERPRRLAALLGAIGACLLLALPSVVPSLADIFLRGVTVLYDDFRWWHLLIITLYYAPPLTAACWVGADYWRSPSRERFWRGPGGAVIKGGLVAGAASGVWFLAEWVLIMPHALAVAARQPGLTVHHLSVWSRVLPAFAMIGPCAAYTAVLAPWRPSRLLGAFAGSGVALGLLGAAALTSQMPLPRELAHEPWEVLLVASHLAGAVLRGAIAGSFAGRWEPEPVAIDASE